MTAVAVTLLAYALGCVSTGYYVVRFLTGDDLRRHATGSTGARNVGRRLGRRAAAVTLARDVAKGAVASRSRRPRPAPVRQERRSSPSSQGTSRRRSSASGAGAAWGRRWAACSCSTGGWRSPASE